MTNPSYSEDDLAVLPEGAEGSSFGCGNPFAFSKIKPGDTVVDLGSGAGLDLLLAAERTGPSGDVIGIDMTDEMIEVARANIAKAGHDHVEVRHGLIESLPIESASVDWVISNCVVNLSPDKPRVFAEIARVLRPGGRMLISDIVVNDVKPWMRAVGSLASRFPAAVVTDEPDRCGSERRSAEPMAKKKTESPSLLDLLSPRFFKALGDPTRVGILTWLAAGRRECTVSEVAEACTVDTSVVSRHLAHLRDAGILSNERRSKEVFYRVRAAHLVSFLRQLADAIERCC